MRTLWLVGISLIGCTKTDDRVTQQPQNVTNALILLDNGQFSEIIIGPELKDDRLTAVINHEKTEFPWIGLRTSDFSLDPGAEGLFDLTKTAGNPVFRQVYMDTCNPAAPGNPGTCWFLEEYTGGQEGLEGVVSLKVAADGQIEADFEVAWQGITDRFGDPPQSFRHETSIRHAIAKQFVVSESAP